MTSKRTRWQNFKAWLWRRTHPRQSEEMCKELIKRMAAVIQALPRKEN